MANFTELIEEVSSQDDLFDCYTFRYTVYSSSRLGAWIKNESNCNLDMDIYDLFSNHFVLRGSNHQIISYMRIVNQEKQAHHSITENLALSYNYCLKGIPQKLPVMEYYPDAEKYIINESQSHLDSDYKICEPSRLSIKAELRNLSFTKEFINSIFRKNEYNYNRAYLACVESHAKFYLSMGFRSVFEKCTQIHSLLPPIRLLKLDIENTSL